MPGPLARPIILSDEHRAKLESIVRAHGAAQAAVRRARIILLAADGCSNAEIARKIGTTEDTVRVWRGRWADTPTPKSLRDRRRSGRPPLVEAATRATLISLACQRPEDGDRRPFRDIWTQASLQAALKVETGVTLSTSEIGRILRAREIRPHRVKMWLQSQDPAFREKVDVICQLYTSPPAGTTVLCVDEKRLFAHRRRPGVRPCAPNQPCRKEFVYSRHGSSVLMATFDIATGNVFGHCNATRTGNDLVEFMEQVAARYPGPVVVIWDNLNVHYDGKAGRWAAFNARHDKRFTFVYTPKHASWVNQVEIWFSILERRVLRNGSFANVDEVVERTLGYIDHWNADEAHPFNWTFRGTRDFRTRTDLGFHARSPHRLLAS
ncbi:MAG: IS630 family transposase [Proteobacteria bacterium]|nr:MAG: IS630 family transposase [Pseudomonadota bacterium]